MGSNKEAINKLEDSVKELYERCNASDLKQNETALNFTHMVGKIDEFLQAFKNHDEEEMKKYDEIKQVISDTNGRLDAIENKITPMQKEMRANNEARKKFNTWSIRISTVVFLLGLIGAGITFTLDVWNKSNKAMEYVDKSQSRSHEEKLEYYRKIQADLAKEDALRRRIIEEYERNKGK